MSWNAAVPANSVTVASLPGHIRDVKSGILDEDNMVSDSATDVASQQSIKAYVDSGTVTMTNKTLTSVAVNGTGVTLAAGADLIGSATSDITFNTNKFTVAGATGNTVIAGTCSVGGTLDVTGATEVTGVATLGDASLLKTSAAPSTDAMIANKKYVDDQITAAFPDDDALGSWISRSKATSYEAASDGFVLGWHGTTAVDCKTDGSDPPTTSRTGSIVGSFCVPVKKGDFFLVECTSTPSIYWIPLGG